MKRLVVIFGIAVATLSGCAANLITYKPDAGQNVAYNQGVGSITAEGTGASLVMYPTFRYQSGSDLPTFTLMVQDKNGQPLDFDPQGVRAFVDDGRECHVYTLEERVAEIRRQKIRKQIALAIAGGLAAGAAGYAASTPPAGFNRWRGATIDSIDFVIARRKGGRGFQRALVSRQN